MNTEKLKEGMKVKNYKELCLLLGEKVKTGSSKMYQVKDWSRFFEYEKIGTKFVITKIFYEHEIKEKKHIKGRKIIPILESSPELKINIIDTYGLNYNEIASWSAHILKWKCSYCGEHFDDMVRNITYYKECKCTKCKLSKQAKIVHETLQLLNINFKTEYSFSDLKGNKRLLRFDFAVFDKDELKGLIEYDGGYHDTGEQDEYDQLKDNYCKNNNIPLLRIHHTNTDIEYSVVNYIKELNIINVDYSIYISNINDEIKKYKNIIKQLENKKEGLL